VKQDSLELSLRKPPSHLPVFLDQICERPSLAVLVLDVDVSLLHPGVVVPDHVLVLHQGRVREHLVHGDALLVGVAVDLIAGHLLKKKENI
jgi:hypothetical protein